MRLIVVTFVGCAALASCDFLENPDEVQNSTNFAFVEAQIFESRDNRVPVPGVIMIVESDPDSERPFIGPDHQFVTDQSGFVRGAIFPGIQGGDQPIERGSEGELPQTPFEVPPPLFFGDARVLFLFEARIFDIGGGVTLGAGRVINLGTFFLEDFTAFALEG